MKRNITISGRSHEHLFAGNLAPEDRRLPEPTHEDTIRHRKLEEHKEKAHSHLPESEPLPWE